MKYFAATLLLLSTAPLLMGQGTPSSAATANPIMTTVRQMEGRFAKNLTGAADLMPAAKYNFRPTPDQITFAHLVAHSTEANNVFCSAVGGEKSPEAKVSENDTKEVLTKALKDSFAFCEQALAKADDSSLGQTVTLFEGQTGTRGSGVLRMVAAWSDHYSAAAMYLRLNDLLPPSAQKNK